MAQELQTATTALINLLTPAERQSINQAPSPEDVLRFTEFLDETTRKKRIPSVTLRFGSFLDSVQQFSGVVDTFIQSNPTISALIWGGVKTIVQILCNFTDYYEKFADMYLKLGSVCPRLDRFRKLFSQSRALQDAVFSFYATVVKFCHKTLVFLRTPSIKQIAKAAFKPFKAEFKDIEKTLLVQREAIDLEIKLASEEATQAERQEASLYRRQGTHHRQYEMRQWDSLNLRLDKRDEKTKRDILLARICSHDHTAEFLRLREKRMAKAAGSDWFINTPAFRSWQDATKEGVLWCHGKPGSGKSVLATSILDYLFNTRTSETFLCYFFCTFADSDSLKLGIILESILKQILIIKYKWPAKLEQQLEDLYSGPFGRPTIAQLEDILLSALEIPSELVLIVDGIDECPIDVQRSFLRIIARYCSICTNLKVFLSCRTDADVNRTLENIIELNLDLVDGRSDIEEFIDLKLKEKMDAKEIIPLGDKLQEEIKTALRDGANRMFLWVDLQIQDICRQVNKKDIRKLLEDLPRDLDKTYERILKRITDERLAPMAAKIFKWLWVARRPLTLDELAEAVALEEGQMHHSQVRDNMPADTTRMIYNCGNLVIVAKNSNTVHWAHQTVKRYLDGAHDNKLQRVSRTNAGWNPMFEVSELITNQEIALHCMAYLRFSDFERQLVKSKADGNAALGKVSRGMGDTPGWISLVRGSAPRAGWIWSAADFVFHAVWKSKRETSFQPTRVPAAPLLDQLTSQFSLLDYITTYWVTHCAYSIPGTQHILEEHFEKLVFYTELPFPHLPWDTGATDGSSKSRNLALLRWSIEENHVRLFNLACKELPKLEVSYAMLDYKFDPADDLSTGLGLIYQYGHIDLFRAARSMGYQYNRLRQPKLANRLFLVTIQNEHFDLSDDIIARGLNPRLIDFNDLGVNGENFLRKIANAPKWRQYLFGDIKIALERVSGVDIQLEMRECLSSAIERGSFDRMAGLIGLYDYGAEFLNDMLHLAAKQYVAFKSDGELVASYERIGTYLVTRGPAKLSDLLVRSESSTADLNRKCELDLDLTIRYYCRCMNRTELKRVLAEVLDIEGFEAVIIGSLVKSMEEFFTEREIRKIISHTLDTTDPTTSRAKVKVAMKNLISAGTTTYCPCGVDKTCKTTVCLLQHAIDIEVDSKTTSALIEKLCEKESFSVILGQIESWYSLEKLLSEAAERRTNHVTHDGRITPIGHFAFSLWNKNRLSSIGDHGAGYKHIVKHLEDTKTINARDDFGRTVLHRAILYGLSNAHIELLVSAGADPNTADMNGRTCLMALADEILSSDEKSFGDLAELFLAHGADPQAVNNEGKTNIQPGYNPAIRSHPRGLVRSFMYKEPSW